MAYDDGYYYGQCKIICESETVNDNGRTVAITDGKNTWSKALADKVAEFIVPGRSRYTVTLLDGNVTKYTNKFDAGYGECIHVMLADGYDNITRSEFDNRMNAVEKKSSDNATEVSSLKTRMDNVESKANANETNISNTTTKANNNTTDINSLKTRMSTAESNINTHTSNISGLTTRVSNAETNITSVTNKANTNANDISGLKTRMTNVEGVASNAKSKADTNASNISTQTGRIDTINSNLTYGSQKFRYGFDSSTGRHGFFTDDAKRNFIPFSAAGSIKKCDAICGNHEAGSFTITQAHKDNYDVIVYAYAPATSEFSTNTIGGTEISQVGGIFGVHFKCYQIPTKDLVVGSKVTVSGTYDGTGIMALGIEF